MSLRDFEPIFYVLVQQQGKTAAERIDTTDVVLSLEFDEDEKKADQLKLVIDNWDLSHFDKPVWRQGNTVIVTWGYSGNLAPSRECVIQKVEGSTQITVTALSKALLLNKDVKVRTFENTRRSEIVHSIAKEYGFGDDRRFIEDTETIYEHISQARQTDAQFLKRLADAEHFEFYVDFSGLHWHPRKLGQKPLRVMQYYLPPDVGDIMSFNVESDPFAKPTQVTAKGRDPMNKKPIEGKGDDKSTERIALVAPDTGDIGKLTPALEQKSVQPTTETNAAQVKKEADGVFKRSTLARVKLSLECVGDPLVIAKSVIDIRGISKRLSGLYYVNAATHKIDSGGYKMTLKVSTDSTHGHSQDLLAVPTTKGQSKAKPNPAKPGEKQDPGATTSHAAVDPTTGEVGAVRYSQNPVAPQK